MAGCLAPVHLSVHVSVTAGSPCAQMRWSLCYGKDVFDPKGLYTPPGRGLWPRLYAKFWKLPRDAPEVAFWRAYIFQRDVTMGCSRMMLEIEQIR